MLPRCALQEPANTTIFSGKGRSPQSVSRQRQARRADQDPLLATVKLGQEWEQEDLAAAGGGGSGAGASKAAASTDVPGWLQYVRPSRGLVVGCWNKLDVQLFEYACCRGRNTSIPVVADATSGVVGGPASAAGGDEAALVHAGRWPVCTICMLRARRGR